MDAQMLDQPMGELRHRENVDEIEEELNMSNALAAVAAGSHQPFRVVSLFHACSPKLPCDRRALRLSWPR